MKRCLTHGVKKEGKFCDECGKELIVEESVTEVNVTPPYLISGHQKCPGCEFNLDHGHQAFCPGCGHQLKWKCR